MGDNLKRDVGDIPDESGKLDEEKNEIEEFDHSTSLDPRAEMMQEVVAQAKEAREESRKEYLEATGMESDEDPVSGVEEETVEEDVDEDNEEILDKADENSENQDVEREEPRTIRVKVNGLEQELTEEQAQEIIQKNLNADQLMREAAEAKRTYEELNAQHDADPTPPVDADAEAVDTEEVLNKALNKVYDGDIEDAAAELAAILSKSQPQAPRESAPTKQEIAQVVAEIEEHKTLKEAFNRFKANDSYAHITNDPVLMDRVDAFTEDLQRDPEFLKTNPSYDDYFFKAAELTNDWITKITGVAPNKEPSEEIDERLTRKRQAKKPPSPRTVRRGPKDETNKFAKSKSDIIKDIARRRGQTNL